MINYKWKNLFQSQMLKNYNFLFIKTMFIRSIDKPNLKSVKENRKYVQPYNKFFVLDFEATCDNGIHLIKPQEIIEFPCILVELTENESFKIVSCFHSYVKPIVHTELSEYCIQLTGITQDLIINSPPFDHVFQNFCNWHDVYTNKDDKSIIVTSGNWDLSNIFIKQCKLFPSTIQIPDFMYTWINIKKLFALTLGQYPYGIKNMLRTTNLEKIGNIHSGMDDCVNIINIMNYLAKQGCLFKATNKLVNI